MITGANLPELPQKMDVVSNDKKYVAFNLPVLWKKAISICAFKENSILHSCYSAFYSIFSESIFLINNWNRYYFSNIACHPIYSNDALLFRVIRSRGNLILEELANNFTILKNIDRCRKGMRERKIAKKFNRQDRMYEKQRKNQTLK